MADVIIDRSAALAVRYRGSDAERCEGRRPPRPGAVACPLPRSWRRPSFWRTAGRERDTFRTDAAVEWKRVTVKHLQAARRAWRRFGEGDHPAAPGCGDCFADTLAGVTVSRRRSRARASPIRRRRGCRPDRYRMSAIQAADIPRRSRPVLRPSHGNRPDAYSGENRRSGLPPSESWWRAETQEGRPCGRRNLRRRAGRRPVPGFCGRSRGRRDGTGKAADAGLRFSRASGARQQGESGRRHRPGMPQHVPGGRSPNFLTCSRGG